MRLVRLGRESPSQLRASAVTIGNFDGVHRGHRALVERVVAAAREEGGPSVVLTFDPHPARVLSPQRAPGALTTPEQKRELLAGLGVEVVAELAFTAPLAEQSPEDFARGVLARSLQARRVVVGEGFRFGRGRLGDARLLRELGAGLGFTVEALAPVVHAGGPISSSRVREALAEGDAALARALLGRAYFVDASVVRGDGRGRTIGVPTANLAVDNEVLPAPGVYAGRCRVADRWWPAVVNRGRRPTFEGETQTLEAHLIDFDGDLYGARVRLAFGWRLREERRFAGPEALVAQIRRDVQRARELLSSAGDGGV